MDDELYLRRPEPFALPFGLLGTVTWLFVTDLQDGLHYIAATLCIPGAAVLRAAERFGWDERAVAAVLAFVAFAFGGKWVAYRVRDGGRALSAALFACFAAAQAPALLLGFLTMGAMWGSMTFASIIAAFAASPCALVMAKNIADAQRSRPQSLLSRAHRRAIWLYLCLHSVVIASAYANPMFDQRWSAAHTTTLVARTVVFAGTLAGVIAGTLALASFLQLRRLGRRCHKSDLAAVDDSHAETLDIGIGDEIERDVTGTRGAYRSRAETRALLRGNIPRARRSLRWAMTVATTVVALGMIVLIVELGPYDSYIDFESPLCVEPDLTLIETGPRFQ